MSKRRDLRMLWSTNGINGYSGYSVAMKDILYRLAADGWPIAISAFHGIQGGSVDVEYPVEENPKLKGVKIRHYPQMVDPYGADGMYHHAKDYKADVVFSMQDIWPLDPAFLSQIKVWIPYFPIDKDPLPQNVLEKLKFAYKGITFSKFGHDLLEKSDFVSTLIVEGTDVDIFKPIDQKEARAGLNIPQDAFLFSMVAANKENPPRKGFQEILEGFKLFHDKHPEAAMIFTIQQVAPTGFPIRQYAQFLGIADRMFFVNDYEAMFKPSSLVIRQLLNAADCHLNVSQTEGFGLTIIEAQACGRPAIIQDCQSMPELIIEGKTGFAAKTKSKRFTADLSYVNVADPESIYECMEKAYALLKDNQVQVALDCRKWVVDNYNIDTIVNTKWIPFMEDLQDELLGKVVDKVGGISIK